MKTRLQHVGMKGEIYALEYLIQRNFKILAHHFTTHWGELDIIAKMGRKICFIEVKTRVGDKNGKPFEAVGFYKLRSLKRAVNQYLLIHPEFEKYRYTIDVISITLTPDLQIYSLKYFENAQH